MLVDCPSENIAILLLKGFDEICLFARIIIKQ